ncbi:uncharacterized protein LOC104583034 [Brachypodium distachyon]|uniref:uncharacterized protein LOC104583034 n=1 Tax=Brachypodium distachyon TaxID=15368 RepID=UPI00052FF33F|nr:uncharacterized protein LOC104583034 [Brachypodium distachyon]|eukprot:XP_010233000.1 uncharacterized protein LOC104583034 [Brachypodium distachyon]
MSPRYPASEFNRGLHMGRPTFHRLCAELHDAMVRNDPPARQAIPVPTRVAVALMRLAHGMPYREICVHFDMGVSTAHKLFQQFCRAVRAVLRDRFVVSPSAPGQDLYADTVKAKFEALTGIPGVTGAVYTTHVHIIAPQLYVLKYFNPRLAERNANKKGSASYSVVFQCTVDADGAFTDIFLGSDHPDGSSGGSKSDEYVLLKSNLNDNQMMIPGAPPVRLLGGASYQLTDYLLVPYARPSSELTGAQEELNQGVVAGSAVANEAFMKLKARWAFLRRRTEVRIPDLRVIFETCCVLHNFCERFWDELDPELAFELEDDVVPPEIPVRSAAAAQERDAIAHSLFLRRRANN